MNKEKTIKNIFTELVSQDVKYVVLRNYDFILTSSLIDDIDLLINSEDFSDVCGWIKERECKFPSKEPFLYSDGL